MLAHMSPTRVCRLLCCLCGSWASHALLIRHPGTLSSASCLARCLARCLTPCPSYIASSHAAPCLTAPCPLPRRLPSHYWLWHSLWHLFMGLGYYYLYAELTSTKQQLHKEAAAAATAAAVVGQRDSVQRGSKHCGGSISDGGADAGSWGLGMMGALLARVALVTWPQLKQH